MGVKSVLAAIGKDLFLELRRAHVASGLVVFVFCIVYIMYVSVKDFPPETWNALYWVAFLFVGMHTALKSFGHESARRYLYYFTIMSPEDL